MSWVTVLPSTYRCCTVWKEGFAISLNWQCAIYSVTQLSTKAYESWCQQQVDRQAALLHSAVPYGSSSCLWKYSKKVHKNRQIRLFDIMIELCTATKAAFKYKLGLSYWLLVEYSLLQKALISRERPSIDTCSKSFISLNVFLKKWRRKNFPGRLKQTEKPLKFPGKTILLYIVHRLSELIVLPSCRIDHAKEITLGERGLKLLFDDTLSWECLAASVMHAAVPRDEGAGECLRQACWLEVRDCLAPKQPKPPLPKPVSAGSQNNTTLQHFRCSQRWWH